MEPETPFQDGWHLRAICEHLEACFRGEIRNLVINMPPRHCKSLLCSVFFPVWTWINDPSKRWLCSSYSYGLATRDSIRSRRIIQSEWFQMRFPESCLRADQKSMGRYENLAGGTRISTSVLGAATGEGGDFILVDDPHKVLDATSENARTGVINWWNQTMSTRGNDPKTVVRIVVGQRVHFGDLCGAIEEQGTYEHLILPAEYEGDASVTSLGWKDPRTEPGELLWEDRFGREDIDQLKTMLGSYAASAQLQQTPVPQEGGMIKESWLQRYADLPMSYDRLIQSWDTAFLKTQRSDFSANGPAIMDTLKNSLHGIVGIRAEGSKSARLSAVSPLFEAGQVWIPEESPWVQDFIGEILQFPFGRNDDQVDACSQALRRLKKRSNTAILTPRKRLVR